MKVHRKDRQTDSSPNSPATYTAPIDLKKAILAQIASERESKTTLPPSPILLLSRDIENSP